MVSKLKKLVALMHRAEQREAAVKEIKRAPGRTWILRKPAGGKHGVIHS